MFHEMRRGAWCSRFNGSALLVPDSIEVRAEKSFHMGRVARNQLLYFSGQSPGNPPVIAKHRSQSYEVRIQQSVQGKELPGNFFHNPGSLRFLRRYGREAPVVPGSGEPAILLPAFTLSMPDETGSGPAALPVRFCPETGGNTCSRLVRCTEEMVFLSPASARQC